MSEENGDRGTPPHNPLTGTSDGIYCPVSPYYRHRWARAKVVKCDSASYKEILRCRRCNCHIIVEIDMSKQVPTRNVWIVKTLNYETLSQWDAQKAGHQL